MHTLNILTKLKLLIKQKRLSDSLELLETKGLSGEIALFAIATLQDLGVAE